MSGAEIGSTKLAVRHNDLLICKINPRINRVWLVSGHASESQHLASPEWIVFRSDERASSTWLRYFVSSPAARRWLESQVSGVTGSHTRVKADHVLRLTVPVPPLDEQHRMVAVLEDHLSRLDAADAYLAASEDRVTRWARRAADHALESGRTGSGRLADLVDRVEAGRSFGGASPPAGEDGWGVVRVSAMTWGEFRPEENKAVPGKLVDQRWEIHEGDVLVSRANTTDYVGAPVLVGHTRPRLLLSDKSLRLVPREGVDRRWLVQVLASQAVRRQVSALASGTKDSMRNISQAKLLSVQVPTTSSEQQSAVAEVAHQAHQDAQRLRHSLSATRDRSAALRRSLLTAAFSGRL
ncbi:MAG: hypothetical protein M3445_05285 [Actinomycetota bacterium]|nr:hypothetical protein [Actinomycetota bacterium]